MEKDDLAVLLKGAPAEEVDRIHRLAHEWGVGPESSFPVQFALLTRAQWRAAASVPRSLDDSRKWLERHLAEYQRQSAAQTENFAATLEAKCRDLKRELEAIVGNHARGVKEAAALLHQDAVASQSAAREIRSQTEGCVLAWNTIVEQFTKERHDLETICRAMNEDMNWWTVKTLLVIAAVALTGGVFIGHFGWR